MSKLNKINPTKKTYSILGIIIPITSLFASGFIFRYSEGWFGLTISTALFTYSVIYLYWEGMKKTYNNYEGAFNGWMSGLSFVAAIYLINSVELSFMTVLIVILLTLIACWGAANMN